MSRTRFFAPLLGCLGLFIGLLTADAGDTPTTPSKQAASTCNEPAPDLKRCQSIGTQKVSVGVGTDAKTATVPLAYVDTPCGRKYAKQCAALLDTVAKHNTPGCETCEGDACSTCASATKEVALGKGKGNIPKDLRKSYTKQSYTGPKKGRELKTLGHHVLARSMLTRSPGTKESTPATAHRHPAWEDNGAKVESCEEFAYEELYDGMRFVDAVAACAGDMKCEMDIAYLTKAPGIVARELKRKDKRKLRFLKLRKSPSGKQQTWQDTGRTVDRFEVKTEGDLPKNDMFAAPSQLVYAGDYDAATGSTVPKSADLDALVAALASAKDYYRFGPAPAAKMVSVKGDLNRFKDEWDFHKKLRERNVEVSDAEYKEYDRRKREFGRLLDGLFAAQAEGWDVLVARDKAAGKIAKGAKLSQPTSIATTDPIERLELMAAQAAKQDKASKQVKKPKGAHWTPPRSTQPAVGVLAVPTKPGGSENKAVPQARPSVMACDPRKWGSADDGYLADLFYRGPRSCLLGKFLRDEWARKAAGQRSCLDTSQDDCDWSPRMFHRRFVAGFKLAGAQAYLEDTCMAYTGDNFSKAKSLEDAEKYIADMKEKIGDSLRELKAYHGGKKGETRKVDTIKIDVMGKTWSDGEEMGDKDWFAAGYDYTLGWKIAPTKMKILEKDENGKPKRTTVCGLVGHADGGLKAHTTLVGHKITIVNAQLHADVNEDGDGKARVDSGLWVLGIDIKAFLQANEILNKAFTPHHGSDGGNGTPEIPIVFVPGPVPITGAVWAELTYGADYGFHHEVKTSCDPKKIGFKLHGEYGPHLGLDAKAEVGVGVTGLLSAGVRASVELLGVGTPLDVNLKVDTEKTDGEDIAMVDFDAGIDLRLSTLSGYVAAYIEVLFASQEWRIFDWSGLSSKIPIMPKLEANLPLFIWPQTEVEVPKG